jgi:hypothetical protein
VRIGEPVRDYVIEPLEEPVARLDSEDEEAEPVMAEAEEETVPTA